ncbi:hypothetical protein CWC46_09735 [Prodigiosinella confusarubida]|nr:hypothetical protein CWC46_09735 [Serratia sp. ATCC 39006]
MYWFSVIDQQKLNKATLGPTINVMVIVQAMVLSRLPVKQRLSIKISQARLQCISGSIHHCIERMLSDQ